MQPEHREKWSVLPLCSSSQTGWWSPPILNLRPLNHASKVLIQNYHCEADSCAYPSRGLVRVCGFKRRLFQYSASPSSLALSEICVQGHCVEVQSPPLWAGFGFEGIYKVCESSSFSSQVEWIVHTKIFWMIGLSLFNFKMC